MLAVAREYFGSLGWEEIMHVLRFLIITIADDVKARANRREKKQMYGALLFLALSLNSD